MRNVGLRMTIRGIMFAVVAVGGYLGFRSCLERWESRRTVMYLQRDVTRAAMAELPSDLAAAGLVSPGSRQVGDDRTYTAHWTERLEAWDTVDGVTRPLLRVTVSGANGRFSLPPIEVVVASDGSPLERLWLDRLARSYRDKGWAYHVVRAPGADVPAE